MTDTPKKLIADLATGTQEYVDLTEEEITQRAQDLQDALIARLEREAADEALAELKASAKAKLIAGEPLTEEEASTLII